ASVVMAWVSPCRSIWRAALEKVVPDWSAVRKWDRETIFPRLHPCRSHDSTRTVSSLRSSRKRLATSTPPSGVRGSATECRSWEINATPIRNAGPGNTAEDQQNNDATNSRGGIGRCQTQPHLRGGPQRL